jgi:tetratricopeptide (TPR) repeat protein
VLLTGAALGITNRSDSTKPQSRLTATDRLIQTAQKKLNDDPKNPDRYSRLCQLYLQKIRETADTGLYAKCDMLLEKATAIDANNGEVVAGRASVAYGKHSFKEGLAFAQQALRLNPDLAAYYGLQGDGQLELGQYEEAVKSFQAMVDKKPELSAYNRVAYIRELYGDIEGAKTALKSAVEAGSSFSENVAYSQTELAKLQMRTDLTEAEKTYRQALETYPDYPAALEGLGKIAFARQDYHNARKYFQQAFDALPLAQYATALGETFTMSGSAQKANQQYLLAEIALDKSSAGNVNNDYEKSILLSQRKKNTAAAVELAQKAVAARPNIFSADALAWALYHEEKYAEAQKHINEALRLGEHEPAILYHAGMVAEKLGQREQAKAYLSKAAQHDNNFLDSHFSLLDHQERNRALERLAKNT